MTLEKQQFEDVSPIRNGDFPMSCSFSGEYTLVFPMSWLIPNLPFCRPRNCQLEAILPNLPIKSDRDVEAAMLEKVHPVHPQGDKSFRIYMLGFHPLCNKLTTPLFSFSMVSIVSWFCTSCTKITHKHPQQTKTNKWIVLPSSLRSYFSITPNHSGCRKKHHILAIAFPRHFQPAEPILVLFTTKHSASESEKKPPTKQLEPCKLLIGCSEIKGPSFYPHPLSHSRRGTPVYTFIGGPP